MHDRATKDILDTYENLRGITTTKVGTVLVNDDEWLYVTDPCYEDGDLTIPNPVPGRWTAYIQARDYGIWGKRVARLVLTLDPDSIGSIGRPAGSRVGIVGVDSGQMLIGPKITGLDDGEAYDTICNITSPAGIICDFDVRGVVSQSGFGDGAYEVYAAVNSDDEAVTVSVEFETDE